MRRRLLAQRPALEVGEVATFIEHAPCGGADELQDGAPRGALAAAALAHEAQGLTSSDLEVEAVDGVDSAYLALEDDAARDREVDAQVLDLYERLVAVVGGGRRARLRTRGAHAGISAPAISRSRWKQAEARPGSVSKSSGTVCQHSSSASQQRGAKLQPGGR